MRIDVLTSGIWQTNTTILSRGGRCIVVDPGYFPREIDAVAERVRELGRADALVFTHGHWDHVMGHGAFPGVPVWCSSALAAMVASRDVVPERWLESARDFDLRWYVSREAGYRWPTDLRELADGERTELAGIPIRALHLPGHSVDGLGLLAEEDGLLVVGDHLSPCEIPFVDDLEAYRATLRRLIELMGEAVREVVPGHGQRLAVGEAIGIAREDLEYLDRIAEAASRSDVAGALGVPLPRAGDVPGMREHHRTNCGKAGLGV